VIRPATGQVLEPRHGRQVIDRRAWRCLERCRRKLKLDEIPLPVPVEEWIEGPLDIPFGVSDLSYLGRDVLGAAFVADREILVDQRVLNHEGRYRFTCAHELGHLTLHRRARNVFHETAIDDPFAARNRHERQADRFAAAFLMPVPLIERELVRILDERKIKRGKAVIELMRPTPESEWLWRKVLLPEMTRRFAVSFAAAVYRFHELQPRIEGQFPLLPRELVQTLASPTEASSALESVGIENGIVLQRSLFPKSTQPGHHG